MFGLYPEDGGSDWWIAITRIGLPLRSRSRARDAVIDAHPEHYFVAAAVSSEAAVEAIKVARDATEAAAAAWMATRAAWGTVRLSRRRRGLDLGPEAPVDDFGSGAFALSTAVSRPWPGGSRQAYERWLERIAREG